MNAVKRCLTVLAVALVAGACGGDPTAEDAGTNLSIRATPSAVWMRNLTTAEVLLEAADNLGGATAGSWEVESQVGAFFSVAVDSTYQPTTTGGVGVKSKFIVTAIGEGDGSVTISGTGGSVTLPIRVAPDTLTFNVAWNTTTPALAQTLIGTAPAGTRFTAGTEVRFYNGPQARDTADGLARPSIQGYNADSTEITILPAPGANGKIRFTGIANTSTPSLTVNARTAANFTVPTLTNVAAVFSNAAPAVNTPITITLPVNFKFRPTSQASSNGLSYIITARSADSTQITVIPTPGTNGVVSLTNIRFAPLPTLALTLPTAASLTVGAAPNLGDDDATAGPVGSFTATLTAAGSETGIYDTGTFDQAGWINFGQCCGQQDVQLTFTNAGSYTVRVSWIGAGIDVDAALVNQAMDTFLATALTSANPETLTFTATAGQVVFLAMGLYTGPEPVVIKYSITKNN
jgi:hypothetical protein